MAHMPCVQWGEHYILGQLLFAGTLKFKVHFMCTIITLFVPRKQIW